MYFNIFYIIDIAIHQKEFSSIQLYENDIGKLYKCYYTLVQTIQNGLRIKPNKKEKDTGHHVVSIPHILSVLKIVSSGNNKFASKLFSTFDSSYTGKINFREFVLIVWNICTVDTGNNS